MNVGAMEHLDLPIEGMTCVACAARIEKNLNKLPGVKAAVNFASETAQIDFDPALVGADKLVASVVKTGYGVPARQIELAIEGMTCAACATRIETVLNRLPGVEAVVNLATEHAHVNVMPGGSDTAALIEAVRSAGYKTQEVGDGEEAAEKKRRVENDQRDLRTLLVADVTGLGAMPSRYTGSILDRPAFLCRRMARTTRRRRQYGCAGRAGHQRSVFPQCGHVVDRA